MVVFTGLFLTLVWSDSDCWFLLDVSDVTVDAKDSVSSALDSSSVRNSDSKGGESKELYKKRLLKN